LETFTGGADGNDPACGAYRTASLTAIAKLHPALVVMTSIIDKRAASAGDPVGDGWRTGIESTLPRLAALGTRVVVLGDTPLRTDSVPNCIGTAGNGIADCELIRPPDTVKLADWLHQQVTAAGLTWLDPVPLVCSASSCPAVAAGIGMYSDASHITRTWSTHIASALDELLDDAGAFTG
ncbi:MAG: SGNH hydrolase domain-containing protein, partial [Nocardioides sp.]